MPKNVPLWRRQKNADMVFTLRKEKFGETSTHANEQIWASA